MCHHTYWTSLTVSPATALCGSEGVTDNSRRILVHCAYVAHRWGFIIIIIIIYMYIFKNFFSNTKFGGKALSQFLL